MTARKHEERPTVVVVGGGYGGIGVAKALDETSNVVLVEPKDAFIHNIAALRALVDPSWLRGCSSRTRVARPRSSGARPRRPRQPASSRHRQGRAADADYIVLATGSSYPFPAKTDLVDTEHAQRQVRETHRALARADRVLLLGAGPVGIELAGEIRHAWPDKSIVLLDVADEVLGGTYLPELKTELLRQLVGSRIEVLLGSPLRQAPPDRARPARRTFTVTTEADVEVTADIWFRCYGVVPRSDYLGDALAPARRADGFIEVTPTMQVTGQSTVFAVGDLSTADTKMAGFAGRQAALVADNINKLARGESRPRRIPVHGRRHRSAHRTDRRSRPVPRTGRDRRARDHRRREGPRPDGRPVRRALRASGSGSPLTESFERASRFH